MFSLSAKSDYTERAAVPPVAFSLSRTLQEQGLCHNLSSIGCDIDIMLSHVIALNALEHASLVTLVIPLPLSLSLCSIGLTVQP